MLRWGPSLAVVDSHSPCVSAVTTRTAGFEEPGPETKRGGGDSGWDPPHRATYRAAGQEECAQ